MNRTTSGLFRGVALATALIAVTGGCEKGRPEPVPAPSARQHLVLLTLDTTRADYLTPYGHPRDTSPTLAALAKRGVIFDDALSQSISTPPSHASMLTGRNPARHGLRRLSGETLSPTQVTLAEILSAHGFNTAAFVSGLPLQKEVGVNQGFAVYDEVPAGRLDRPARETNERVSEWLAKAPAGPTFLWVHYFDPHAPYTAPGDYQVRFAGRKVPMTELLPQTNVNEWTGNPGPPPSPEKTAEMAALYEAEIRYMDDQIAELLKMLEAAGILQDAIVGVMADHGEGLGEHGYYFAHWDVHLENSRIPFILARPDGKFAGRRVAQTVRSIDFMPTVLRWLDIPLTVEIDGKDLTALIEGAETTSRESSTEQLEYFDVHAVRTDEWFLLDRQERSAGTASRQVRLYSRSADAETEVDPAQHAQIRDRLTDRMKSLSQPPDAAKSEEREVSDETAEKLKALGYLQ